MSSPDSKTLISTSVPISELVKRIKHSFLERDFNEVQNVLTERENAMKLEIENLTSDRDSARKEVRSIEIEKSRTEEKLHKLEETINRLFKEKSASSNREKNSDDWYGKLYTQSPETMNEKNKLIAELNEKINELKNKMGQEIEDLRHERLAATQSVLELKRQKLEANKIIDELTLKKLESDKKVEYNKSRLENLTPRIMKIEELLADILNVNVGDLGGIVGEVCKIANISEEGANLEFQDFKGKNGSILVDAKNVVVELAGSRSSGLSRKGAHPSGTPALMSGDVIEIPDSDDETNPARPAHISNRGVLANVGENETNCEKFVQSPSSSSQRGKRERTESVDDFLADLIAKRPRNICTTSHENDNNVSVDDTKTPLQKFNVLNKDSSDSDESCSESTINDLIASLGSNKIRRK